MYGADWAFEEYQKIRGTLPRAAYPQHSTHVDSLGAISDDFDVFLFDAFGVLNIGDTAIPSALTRIAALQKAGKAVMVLTNSASQTAEALHAKFRRFGFDFATNDIVASRDALCTRLADDKRLWAAMATPATRVELLPANTRLLGNAQSDYDTAEGFLIISAANWKADQQHMLEHSLRQTPRPVLCGNPDITAPREDGFSLQPGHYANQLAAIPGVTVENFGKPYAGIFDHAFARMPPTPKARILMIGDTLHTDILGAAAYGLKTALVTAHGFFRDQDSSPYITISGIRPHYILPAI